MEVKSRKERFAKIVCHTKKSDCERKNTSVVALRLLGSMAIIHFFPMIAIQEGLVLETSLWRQEERR